MDPFTEIGHDGRFPQAGDFYEYLAEAGFVAIEEHYEDFSWDFPDRQTMVSYCKMLFRMTLASLHEVESEIDPYLSVTETANRVSLHWSLTYATGAKPA